MATVKISALPQVTAYTLNDVVAIVDSGSTQTSKITTGNLFNNYPSRISDLTTADTNTFIGAGSDVNSSTTESIFQGSTKYSGVMFGIGQINNTSDSAIIGSTGGASSVTMDNDSSAVIIGGFRSSMSNVTRGYQIASQDINHNTGFNTGVIGVDQGTLTSSYKSTIIGTGNGLINNSTEALIASSRNSSIDLQGGNSGVIIGSKTGNISLPSPSAEINGIYSSDNSTINTSGIQSVILNSRSATIGGSNQGSTMVSTDGKSSLYDWTTHTDNIHTYRTETFTEVNGGNVGGAINVDCSTGSFFLFTMTADTTPNFINLRNGQRFFFIIYNNGAWAVPTATVNGAPGTVFSKNGTINPQNNSYSKYVATYDGINGLLFLDEEIGFAAV